MMSNAWTAAILTLGITTVFLRLAQVLVKSRIVQNSLSRKIVHIGIGLIFIACWLLFPESPASKWYAASIPFLFTLVFLLVGLGLVKNKEIVNSMSRSGDAAELMRGPFFYGVAITAITLIYWRNSPIGLTSLVILCAGDGSADLFGTILRGPVIPWSKSKRFSGSLAMLLAGFIFSLLYWLMFKGYMFPNGFTSLEVGYLLLIVFACVIIESLPFRDIDNLTIPLTALIMGHILLG